MDRASAFAAIDSLIAATPTLAIRKVDASVRIPRMRKVQPCKPYNGFDGRERMETWEVAKWLMRHGAMPLPGRCDLCDGAASIHHAEDYFDFSKYVPVCKSCHMRLHNRVRNFELFQQRLQEWMRPAGHWIYHLQAEELPVADWTRARGMSKPSFSEFSEAVQFSDN